jgi:pimeloyl-ACP methyl ester carboxylesterase
VLGRGFGLRHKRNVRGRHLHDRRVRALSHEPLQKADFDRRLAELPAGVFGWFSKQGWVNSAWERVNFCLEYPKPDFSLHLRPPYNGPFPDVPVLMLNGDIDLQTPLEEAEKVTTDWPNSVFLTIKDATHVTLQTSECSVATLSLPWTATTHGRAAEFSAQS